MTKKELANYQYTIYQLEESLKCELDELKDDWLKNPSSAYSRGKMNAFKETLYFLTLNPKWLSPLEDLHDLLLKEQ